MGSMFGEFFKQRRQEKSLTQRESSHKDSQPNDINPNNSKKE